MYNSKLTEETRLEVELHPIHIVYLTNDGLLPIGPSESAKIPSVRQEFKEFPPSNLTENVLMSMWLNTHQAMFLSTGMAAHCATVVTTLLRNEGNAEDIRTYLALARDARLASAAYTGLPHLTKSLYEAYIRESMRVVHPGFSGVSNQEAIAMEHSLHELKLAKKERAYRDKALAKDLAPNIEELFSANRRWWQFHGFAMSKYVTTPISLARMDFAHRSDVQADENFDDYRDRVLRNEKVKGDYDRYFAIQRREGLSIADYRLQLTECLQRSEPYVDKDGDLADFRQRGEIALNIILDLEEARTQRAA